MTEPLLRLAGFLAALILNEFCAGWMRDALVQLRRKKWGGDSGLPAGGPVPAPAEPGPLPAGSSAPPRTRGGPGVRCSFPPWNGPRASSVSTQRSWAWLLPSGTGSTWPWGELSWRT